MLDRYRTWTSPIPAFGGDKQWLAIDRISGIGGGNIYQHGNIQKTCCAGTNFTRSIDGGVSFQTSVAGPQPFMKSVTMDIGPEGTLYLAGSTLNAADGHLFSKSSNAQYPTQVPAFTTALSISMGGTRASGGVNPAGLLGQVSIATDHSSSSLQGNVYVLASVNPTVPIQ